jgi:hypothetical protein
MAPDTEGTMPLLLSNLTVSTSAIPWKVTIWGYYIEASLNDQFLFSTEYGTLDGEHWTFRGEWVVPGSG